MTTWWWAVAPIFAWIAAALANRFLEGLVGLICRMLPPDQRDERRDEWVAELRSSGNPIERLWYAFGLARCGWVERERTDRIARLVARRRQDSTTRAATARAVAVAGSVTSGVGGAMASLAVTTRLAAIQINWPAALAGIVGTILVSGCLVSFVLWRRLRQRES